MTKEAFIMGMPVVIEVVDSQVTVQDIEEVFDYFREVDEQFSTYKDTSEISKINRGELLPQDYSKEMKKVFSLSEQTKLETNGFFDIEHQGKIDPSGIVKGYAIWKGAELLRSKGFRNFYVEIAGDIQTNGLNKEDKKWKIGIENPFNRSEIIKVVELSGEGIATSGSYIRGNHIYNPKTKIDTAEIASVSVIGKNVYEADRFATAAFAAGLTGIDLIKANPSLAGFMVTLEKMAIKTSNFEKYEQK